MSLKFSTKLYSAPIAGYTNDYLTYYFHLGGADYIYSEMFNVNEIIRFKDKLEKYLKEKIINILFKFLENMVILLMLLLILFKNIVME